MAHAAQAPSACTDGRRRDAGDGVPARAAGEPAVLHREERAQAGAVAARDRAHRAQDRAVLLPAAPDQGDERRLGNVLALHHPPPALRRKAGQRCLHDRVAAGPHQRDLPAAVPQPLLQRHEPVHGGLPDLPGPAPHVREPDRRGLPLGAGDRRQRLAHDAGLCDAQLQGRELPAAVPVAARDPRAEAVLGAGR
ncbi:hypothetical protein D3C72_1410550 [compost metagenome]